MEDLSNPKKNKAPIPKNEIVDINSRACASSAKNGILTNMVDKININGKDLLRVRWKLLVKRVL